MNALDGRGVSPLHLAHSRLRIARNSDDAGGQPLSRKTEIYGIVDMLREYLVITKSKQDETDELEALASKLTLSETPEEVCSWWWGFGRFGLIDTGCSNASIQRTLTKSESL